MNTRKQTRTELENRITRQQHIIERDSKALEILAAKLADKMGALKKVRELAENWDRGEVPADMSFNIHQSEAFARALFKALS